MKKSGVLAVMLCVLFAAACSENEDSLHTQANYAAESQASGTADAAAEDRYSAPRNYGFRPPNGEEFDSMYFQHYGTNPFIDTEEDRLSTFAVDVDTGSYTVMRSYVSRGSIPPQEAVRVEEFVNYFQADYEPPRDRAFSIVVDGGESPYGDGYHLLRIGIKGKEIPLDERKNAHLVFVIDVSGSMNRENRLELVKKSLRMLVDQLKEEDTVGIVAYGSEAEVILPPTSADRKERILRAISRLQPGGSTNAEEGLVEGYAMAAETFERGAINRVILCSDGVANVGETGAEGILKQIADYAEEGITLSTLGFGMGNYNDVLMEQLADKGNGSYAYIDTFSEARRIFMEQLTGTLMTIAQDVKVQVEFDPEKVERYRLLGYENRDMNDADFHDDTKDAGEIGAGHTVTALYEIKVKDGAKENLGKIDLRYKDTELGRVVEMSESLRIGEQLDQELMFLASVAEFAEILRGSDWAKDSSLEAVLELAEKAAEGPEQLEFVELVKDTMAIQNKDSKQE
jgi:Ca-activated chloride channel family protein